MTPFDDLPSVAQDALRKRFEAIVREDFDTVGADILDAFLNQPAIAAEYERFTEHCWQSSLADSDTDAAWCEWLRDNGIEP